MITPIPAIHRIAFLFAAAVTAAVLSAADVRVYVQFSPGQKAAVQASVAQAGGVTHHEFDDLNAVAVTLPEAARGALQRNPNVVLIEEDPVRSFLAQTVPYGIPMVQAPDAVAAGATGAGIKVGVLDSGVFRTHEDLQSVAITGEPDFGVNNERTWTRDILSHGTHVVGTIAAANNSLGVLGVSPGAVAIHMVKVLGDTNRYIYSSDLVAAARAAAFKGCRIISMSLGGFHRSRIEERGMNSLYNDKHVLLVGSAGNDGNTDLNYPASYESVISVAAIDDLKAVASFSQKNAQVELAAPGVGVLSTVSYIDTTSVTVDAISYSAIHVEFSGRGTVSSLLVLGGLGHAPDASWSGKVVLLDRGTNTFNEKVRNVQLSGGVACIIANNESGSLFATLGERNSATIPAVSVTQADGTTLKGKVGLTTTVTTIINQPANGYDFFDGTSMSAPHVAGVAALIWSKYPGATNAQIRQVLDSSAEDLGMAGRDTSYGYGLVRAKAALDALAALNPPAPSDTTAPIINGLTATVTNSRNGLFEISWTTNEPATTDVQLSTTVYADPILNTTHSRTFRGRKGATYTYWALSTDVAGNTAVGGPLTITIQ